MEDAPTVVDLGPLNESFSDLQDLMKVLRGEREKREIYLTPDMRSAYSGMVVLAEAETTTSRRINDEDLRRKSLKEAL